MQTLLQNIQDTALELGLPYPTTAAGSTDDAILQLVALMNRVGDSLLTEVDPQVLAKEYRFSTVYYTYTGNTTSGSTTISGLSSVTGLSTNFMVSGTGLLQDTMVTAVGANSVTVNIPANATGSTVSLTFGQVLYSMPSDYDRMVNKTAYNKTNRWSVLGPKDAQEWQWLKASYVTTGPRMRYRIVGDKFNVWPMPSSTVVLGFEYQSNGWITSSAGVSKSKFTADDDVALFPDRLLILGTKMRFWQIKGFDTTNVERDYQRALSLWKSAQAGADTLSLAARYPDYLLTAANIPDSGYGNSQS